MHNRTLQRSAGCNAEWHYFTIISALLNSQHWRQSLASKSLELWDIVMPKSAVDNAYQQWTAFDAAAVVTNMPTLAGTTGQGPPEQKHAFSC